MNHHDRAVQRLNKKPFRWPVPPGWLMMLFTFLVLMALVYFYLARWRAFGAYNPKIRVEAREGRER